MIRSRWARRGAYVLVAVMASASVPLVASAHTSSYDDVAKIAPSPAPSPLDYEDLLDEQRYFVCNHGYCSIYRESNGVTDMGVVDYKRAPSAWRSQSQVSIAELFQRAANGAQTHHTCQTAALETESAITGWQGASDAGKSEPFWAYVPFQKASAGLGDHAEEWIAHVQTLTGVDLTQVSDDPAAAEPELRTLCQGLPGGVFVPADAIVTPAADVNSATTADTVAPLNEQIDSLRARNGNLRQKVSSLKARVRKLKEKVAQLQGR